MSEFEERLAAVTEELQARLRAVLDDCPGDDEWTRLIALYMLVTDLHGEKNVPSVVSSFAAALQKLGGGRYKAEMHIRYATHTDVFTGDAKLERYVPKPEGEVH
ncbi:MAG: hypothetical protein OXF93_02155 [Acidobacteria bacterium]|nr:hypothetical protein [Acidobacteriota bacterium]